MYSVAHTRGMPDWTSALREYGKRKGDLQQQFNYFLLNLYYIIDELYECSS